MNKVCVVGCCCSGKSTFARKLGEVTGLPIYHLDKYYLKAGWEERNQEEWLTILYELLSNDQWIMDGNYNNTQDIRFSKADTIVFLDFPRYKCIINYLKRPFIYRNKSRDDVPEGCYEKFDYDMYKWIWAFKNDQDVQLKERLKKLQNEKTIVVLKSYKEINEYVEKIKKKAASLEINKRA
jgi:adenylate kinase family enzyme